MLDSVLASLDIALGAIAALALAASTFAERRRTRGGRRLSDMKRVGQFLMALGATVGVVVAVAMVAHVGVNGASWLVNVALAKLGLVAAGGLMAGGAVSVRIGKRREQSNLLSGDG